MCAALELPGDVAAAHSRAMTAGHATYQDPATGYSVFTAAWLAGRGTCCGSNCRHCPYQDQDDTSSSARRTSKRALLADEPPGLP